MLLSKQHIVLQSDWLLLFHRRGGARLYGWSVLLFLRVWPWHGQLFAREWGKVSSYRRGRGGGRHRTTSGWTYPHSGHKGLAWAMVRYNPFTKTFSSKKMSCPCKTSFTFILSNFCLFLCLLYNRDLWPPAANARAPHCTFSVNMFVWKKGWKREVHPARWQLCVCMCVFGKRNNINTLYF